MSTTISPTSPAISPAGVGIIDGLNNYQGVAGVPTYINPAWLASQVGPGAVALQNEVAQSPTMIAAAKAGVAASAYPTNNGTAPPLPKPLPPNPQPNSTYSGSLAGSAPVGASQHPPQPTAGPPAQPGKINPTVTPGGIPTAQRLGTGTLSSGAKGILVMNDVFGEQPVQGSAAPIPAAPGAPDPGSNPISEFIGGAASWTNPGMAAGSLLSVWNVSPIAGVGLWMVPVIVLIVVWHLASRI